MSRGLGQLTKLQILSKFVMSQNSCLDFRCHGGLKELNRLNKLRGTLKIKGVFGFIFFYHSISITHHSSLITQFFTLIWHHHFIFITQYFSHHLWVPHLLHCQSTSVLLLAEHFHPIKTLSFLISPSPSPSALSLSQSRNPNPNP